MLTSGRTESVHDAPTTHDHKCTDVKPTNERKLAWGFAPNPIYFYKEVFLQSDGFTIYKAVFA